LSKKTRLRMKKADLISGFVLLALSVYLIEEAWRMPPSGTASPGAGFLPFWLGVILAGLAIRIIVGAWLSRSTEKSPFPEKKKIIAIGSVLGGLAVYIAVIEYLGFLVDTLLYVAFLMGIVQREKWLKSLLVAVSTAAGLYVIFQVLMGVGLPANRFGF
jgi:putative tricarboxylic transport membrane protein